MTSRVFYSFPWPGAARGVDGRDVQRSNAQPVSHLVPVPLLISHLPFFSFSLFSIPMFIHSVCLAFSALLFLSLPFVCSRGSICLVYTLYVHLPTAKTTPRTKPKQRCQTSVRRVAWPFAFRLCCATQNISRTRFIEGFSVLLSSGRGRRQPCLRSKPATSIFVASVSRIFDSC